MFSLLKCFNNTRKATICIWCQFGLVESQVRDLTCSILDSSYHREKTTRDYTYVKLT